MIYRDPAPNTNAGRFAGPTFCIALVVALGFAGNSDYEAEQISQANYCDMVALYAATEGKHGWPPFEGDCQDVYARSQK